MAQLGCGATDYHSLYMPCMYEDYENERICENYRNMPSKMAVAPVPGGLLSIPMTERNHRRMHSYEPPPTSTVPVTSTGMTLGVHGSTTTGSTVNGTMVTKRASLKGSGGIKPTYKHVPHRDKPPHLVERRNARERRRVQAVNTAFSRLRKCVPVENRNKRISKVKTLQKAIEYISYLEQVLADNEEDGNGGTTDVRSERMTSSSTVVNKENSQNTRWVSSIGIDSNCKEHHSPYISSAYDTYNVPYPN